MTSEATPQRTINYAFLLGGITAIIFGIILLIFRDEALTLLVLLLGLWWLIQGAFMLFSILIDREDWLWQALLGVLGLAAGIIVLSNTGDAVDFLGSAVAIVLGVIGVVIGVSAIFGSFRGGGFGALAFGVISVLIGLLFIFNSQFTFDFLITLFAVLLLIDGVSSMYLAVRYK